MRWFVLAMSLSCAGGDPCEGGGGTVEVRCDEEGCFCQSGSLEGEPCEEEECETVCLGCDDDPLVLE